MRKIKYLHRSLNFSKSETIRKETKEGRERDFVHLNKQCITSIQVKDNSHTIIFKVIIKKNIIT